MEYEIGTLITGKVINVKPYAVFLEFEEGTQGLLHISEISNNYIRDIERYASIGDELKVKVLSIDENNGFLRVSLKQVPHNEMYSSHENKPRKALILAESSFTPLENKMPEWMQNTLDEMNKKGQN